MAAGGSINHPKSVYGKKRTSQKKRGAKKVAKNKNTGRKNVDPLTTSNILRKTRSNPMANISLSGKKKRLLLKQLKREEMEKHKMDVVTVEKPKAETKPRKVNSNDDAEKMDMM